MAIYPKHAHLSRADHLRLARLLNQAQDSLNEATVIVGRATYTDHTLRIQNRIQERLMDPLRNAWEVCTHDDPDNPYQSIGYALGPVHLKR